MSESYILSPNQDRLRKTQLLGLSAVNRFCDPTNLVQRSANGDTNVRDHILTRRSIVAKCHSNVGGQEIDSHHTG